MILANGDSDDEREEEYSAVSVEVPDVPAKEQTCNFHNYKVQIVRASPHYTISVLCVLNIV